MAGIAPDEAADLESILSTSELRRRPSRLPDYEAENRALVTLARELAASPEGILQKLADTTLTLCHAHSAGISLLEDNGKTFYWRAIAGEWATCVGTGAPSDFGPCGTVVDCKQAQLFSHPERYFTYLADITPAAEEALLIPFYIDGQAAGAIWVIAHDQSLRFDGEHLRVMTSLSSFAAAAYQTLLSLSTTAQAHQESQRIASALRHSEERLRGFFNSTAVGVAVLTPEGQFLQVNDAFCSITGYSGDELQSLDYHALANPDDIAQMQDLTGALLAGQTPSFAVENRCTRKNGVPIWVQNSVSLTRDACGQPLHLVMISQDITNRKQAEDALRKSESRLAAQERALELAVGGGSIQVVLTHIVRAAQKQVGEGARTALFFVDVHGTHLRFGAAAGMPETYTHAMDGLAIGPTMPSCGSAAYTGQMTIVRDVASDARWSPYLSLARAHGICACWSFPIRSFGGKVLGTLAIYHGTPREPSSSDIESVGLLAQTAALVIEQHRTAEERQRAEEALRQSQAEIKAELRDSELLQRISAELIQEGNIEALYEKIMDAAVAIMRSDFASMQMLYPERGSGGELRLLAHRGFNPDSARFWEWVRADSGSTCGAALRSSKRIIATDVEECEFIAGTDDLASYRLSGIRSVQTTPLFSRSGKMLGMISTHWRHPHQPPERDLRLLDILARQAADLIERKQAEEAVRRRTEQYETLLNEAPLGVYLVDGGLRIRDMNPTALSTFGNIPGLIGGDFDKAIHVLWAKEYADEIVTRFRHTLETGEPYIVPERIEQRADCGVMEYHEWRIHRIPLPEGGYGVVCYFRDIAAQVKAREAIMESEERFRTLADNMSQLAWMADAKGAIFWYNQRWFDYTGTTLEQMRDAGCKEVHHPDHVERVAAHLQHCWDTGELWEDTFPLRGKDGNYRWFLSRAVPIRNAEGKIVRWFGTNTDITEQREAEEALRDSAERLRFMAESMPQKIFTAKPNGDVDYVNRQWTEFTGLPSGQVGDWNWNDLIHPYDVEENSRLWKHSIQTGEPFKRISRFRRTDGVYRWHLSLAHAMRDAQGEISMWIGSSTDIHEQKQIEEELRRANEDLNQFAFAASHDLQEPLRMISSYSQLLVKSYAGQVEGQASTYVDFITEGNKRIRDLLTDLLTYTSLGANTEKCLEAVDLNLVLRKVIENLSISIEENGAIVTSEELPVVHGQEPRLVQLFQNLVGNAIKYRSHESPRVHICAENCDHYWRFAVVDNGIGIDRDYHKKIFGVFKRLHGKKVPGTGIGLAICQRIVEAYGGRIWVDSRLGQGATFYFTLPFPGALVPPHA